ncbi:MAG: HD domain-containing protein [Pirellulaceae bacterium]|nr:HD domain-containing protein [Pirellulaceae bacterium]
MPHPLQDQSLIERTAQYVQTTLRGAEGGHDWFHTLRVWNTAKTISAHEDCDRLIVQLGALLHDIADSKFHQGDEELGPRLAGEFLQSQAASSAVVTHVQQIIRHVSFKGGHGTAAFHSIELDIVQDADRLDAIGAIGIARAFNYGGFKQRPLFDPDVPPKLDMTREQYKTSNAPTINHFYEKLLLLKDRMNTSQGRAMAEARHQYMVEFLAQFFAEQDGLR